MPAEEGPALIKVVRRTNEKVITGQGHDKEASIIAPPQILKVGRGNQPINEAVGIADGFKGGHRSVD